MVKKMPRSKRPRQKKNRKGRKAPKQVQQVVVYNPRSVKTLTQRFVKSLYQANLVAGADTTVATVNAFTMASVPDIGAISVLYNRYKLNKIHMTFTLKDAYGGSDSGVNLITARMPTLWIRYNYDSENITPSTDYADLIEKLQEVPNVKSITFTPNQTKFTYTLIPFTVAPVYLSSVATGYQLQKKRYIDMAYLNVPHYGVMWAIDELPEGLELVVDVSYDFTVKYTS